MAISVGVIKLFGTGENCSATHMRKHCVENEILENSSRRAIERLLEVQSLISFNTLITLSLSLTEDVREFIFGIYPQELTLSKTTESYSAASYLDLLFTRDNINNITTKLYDEHDRFGFHIVNFPLCHAIFHQHQPMVYMYLTRYARCCSN